MNTLSTPYYLAITNCPNQEVATSLGQRCVENKLAACVNILPEVQSIYQWKDKIENDCEVLMMMKTDQLSLSELESFIIQNHPYETPEFITINIESGSERYLDWIHQSLSK